MSDDLGVKLKDGPPSHYYVAGPRPGATYVHADEARLAPCARPGCGKPPEHPVHLRPPGDEPAIDDERQAANA